MSFTVKDWKDDPDTSTPLSAAALENLETRLSGYTDSALTTGLAGKANTSHTHTVGQLGTGTPASGKYLDGAGAWTTLPTQSSDVALTNLGGATGAAPEEAASATPRMVKWYPNDRPPAVQPDTLFLLDARDEQDIVERGGWMSTDLGNYFAAAVDKAAFVAGRWFRKAIGEKTTANGAVMIQSVGLIRGDEFTATFQAKAKGAEGSTLTGELLSLVSNDGGYGLLVRKAANTSISAIVRANGGVLATATITGLTAGDLAADTPTAVAVSLKGTALAIRIGNNAKSATATLTGTLPDWAFLGGWIAPLTGVGRTELSGDFEISDLHINGTAMIPGATSATDVKTPTITVDATTLDGSVELLDMAGVMAQYPGWRDEQADGQTGGGGPGLTGNAIRDTLITTALADGCRLFRIDAHWEKLTFTGTASAPVVSSWTALDEPMDLLLVETDVKLHITLGYCPHPLMGSTRASVPSSTSGFAQLCSDAITHWKARYGSGRVATWWFTLWNEPALSSFWAGTPAELATLWLAVQAKLATDHPDIEFSGTDEHAVGTASTDPSTAVIKAAHDNGRPYPFTGHHAYELDDYYLNAETVKLINANLAAQGLTGTPIRVGEWAVDNNRITFWAGAGSSTDHRAFKGHPTFGVDYAAACVQRVVSMINAGAISAVFTRLGILDSSYTGNEQLYGLFTNENPPRPLPVYAAFQALWHLTGDRVAATTNHAPLHALATVDSDGNVVVVYCSYRTWDPTEIVRFAFDFTGLPDSRTWELYRLDHRDTDETLSDGRLRLVGRGGTTDPLPLGADLTAQGVGMLVINAGAPPTPTAPTFTAAPAVSGSTTVSSTLTCNGGTVTGQPAPTRAYQWQRDGTNLSGATSSTYQAVTGDIGHAVTCTVTLTNGVGSPASATSNAITVTNVSAPTNTVAPAVTGSAVTGQTLTCSTGTWTGSPTGYTYQWKRGASNISGATSSTYQLQVADQGQSVTCVVTATNAGGSASQASNAVTPSAAATVFVNDTFTGADGTLLSAHTGETGATWTKVGGNSGDFKIASNAVYDFSTTAFLTASGVPAAADYDVEAVFVAPDNTGGAGIAGRVSTGEDGYVVQLEGSFVHLYKAVGGSYTELGTASATAITETTVTVKLEMRGSVIKVYQDGVQKISVTDTAVTAKGKAGVRGFTEGNASTTGVRFASFTATDA